MNKVEAFWGDSIWTIKSDINKLAENYEIIDVSITANKARGVTCGYTAMVIYKYYQECILQGFDHYIANDSYGNHIKEVIEY